MTNLFKNRLQTSLFALALIACLVISTGPAQAATAARTIHPSEWDITRSSRIVKDAPKGNVLQMTISRDNPGPNAVASDFVAFVKNNPGKRVKLCATFKGQTNTGIYLQLVGGPAKNINSTQSYQTRCVAGAITQNTETLAGVGRVNVHTSGQFGHKVYLDIVTIELL